MTNTDKDTWWDIFVVDWWYRVPRWLRRPIASFGDYRCIRSFPVGTLIEDCRYHPCIITANDGDGNITAFSLITGKGGYGCSLVSCGIIKLDPSRIEEHIAAYHEANVNDLAVTTLECQANRRDWISPCPLCHNTIGQGCGRPHDPLTQI